MVEAVYNTINLIFAWFAIVSLSPPFPFESFKRGRTDEMFRSPGSLQANFYIFFVILTTSLEDTSFNLKGINVLNVLCQVGSRDTSQLPFLLLTDSAPYLFPLAVPLHWTSRRMLLVLDGKQTQGVRLVQTLDFSLPSFR